jgi:DNA mismatch endonuclease, patch repair protein
MDVHDKITRSKNMSKIRSKDTIVEIIVRRYLHSYGFRYRLHEKNLPGKPDIVFKNYKIAIFVHGCYFHGHEGCKFATTSKTREEYWKNRITGNIIRDIRNEEELRNLKWNVIKIWECEIEPRKKTSEKRIKTLEKLKYELSNLMFNDTGN